MGKARIILSAEALKEISEKYRKIAESYSGIYKNPAFLAYIKEAQRLKKTVNEVMEQFRPVIDFQFKAKELAESISRSIPKIPDYVPPPRMEFPIVMPPSAKKQYTEDELDEIVKRTIRTTIKNIADKPIIHGRLELPEHITWEDITIKFFDGHDVRIVVGEKIFDSNYREMGFEDKRKRTHNVQWALLKTLSENRSEISWKNNRADPMVKKQKQLLSRGLKRFFNLPGDPFYPYKKEKKYKIKINLVPEKESINNNLPDNKIEDKYDDLDDFMKETAPQI